MATKEAKPEAKKPEHKKVQEDISHDQDNDLPPLPYKTCNLRVSIHCEGCKRKVKKILTNIEGVCAVDVDLKQQKVTVVGIVSPEILIKKLLKAGKNAELVPGKPDLKENKQGHNPNPDPKNKEKKKDKDNTATTNTKRNDYEATTSGDRNAAGCCAGEKLVTAKNCGRKNAVSGGDDTAGEGNKGGDEADKAAGGGETGGAGGPVKEKKAEIKDAATGSAGDGSPAADGGADVDMKVEAGGGGSVGVGKKKKKKGQKGNNGQNAVDGQRSIDTPANTGSSPSVVAPPVSHPMAYQECPSHQHLASANHSPPRHQMYPYPPHFNTPQPQMPMPPAPVYGLSYNVAQPPASVYGASYYTAPPPYSYAYMHQGFPPSDQNPYGSRPSDSFEYFSDENPNACSVM